MQKGNGSGIFLIFLVLVLIGAGIFALIGENQNLQQEKQVTQEALLQAAEKWATKSKE